MVALASEPQSIGKVLDSGFKLFVRAFAGIFPLSLAAAAVIAVPNIANVVINGPDTAGNAVPGLTILVLFLVVLPIYLILIAAVVYRLGAAAELHEASTAQALARGARCVLALVGAAILYLLALAGGLILLVIPGIIVSLSLSFGFFAIVLDGESALVWGNWWRTLTVVSVPVVIVMILYIGLLVVLGVTLVRPRNSKATRAAPSRNKAVRASRTLPGLRWITSRACVSSGVSARSVTTRIPAMRFPGVRPCIAISSSGW